MNNNCMVWHDTPLRRYNGYGLTILWDWPYGQRDLLLCLALDPMVVCNRHTMYGCGHYDGFASSVGHPKTNLVEMLIYDGM
jgi:hypothetical protein